MTTFLSEVLELTSITCYSTSAKHVMFLANFCLKEWIFTTWCKRLALEIAENGFSQNTRACNLWPCCQSPCLHKPAIVIVTSFSFLSTALAAPALIMTSFSLWRYLLLSWPRPPLRTYIHTDTLPHLMYKYLEGVGLVKQHNWRDVGADLGTTLARHGYWAVNVSSSINRDRTSTYPSNLT